MNLDITTLLLLAILGAFFLVMAISRPELGLLALVVVVYTNMSDVLITSFGLPSVTQPLIGVLGIVIVARRIVFRDTFEGWTPLAVLLGIYLFLGYLSVFYATDPELAQKTLTYYLKNAVIGLIVIFILQKRVHLIWAIWGLISSGVFLGTISTYQVFTGNYDNSFWGFGQSIYNGSATRLWGPLGDPNYYAEIMVALVPFVVDRILHEKKLVLRIFSGWAMFVLLITIYNTSSRGGYLALLVVGFLIFASQPSRPYAGIILFGAFLLISYQYLPAQYTARISTLLQLVPGKNTSAKVDVSLQGRTSANIVGWTVFTDHPVFGVGAGNLNANFPRYARELGLSNEAGGSAHNLYLEIAAERGVLGLMSFISIIYFTFRDLHRTKASFVSKKFKEMADICDALNASMAGYLVAATFLHDAHIRYFWLLLGIAWSMPQVFKSLAGEQQVLENKLNRLKRVYTV